MLEWCQCPQVALLPERNRGEPCLWSRATSMSARTLRCFTATCSQQAARSAHGKGTGSPGVRTSSPPLWTVERYSGQAVSWAIPTTISRDTLPVVATAGQLTTRSTASWSVSRAASPTGSRTKISIVPFAMSGTRNPEPTRKATSGPSGTLTAISSLRNSTYHTARDDGSRHSPCALREVLPPEQRASGAMTRLASSVLQFRGYPWRAWERLHPNQSLEVSRGGSTRNETEEKHSLQPARIADRKSSLTRSRLRQKPHQYETLIAVASQTTLAEP